MPQPVKPTMLTLEFGGGVFVSMVAARRKLQSLLFSMGQMRQTATSSDWSTEQSPTEKG